MDVVLEDAKDVAVEKYADVEDNADIHGRKIVSQAKIYKIDFEHANKVLSIAASDTITSASTTITTADVLIPAATTTVAPTLTAAPSKRRKGVVIRDPEESTTSIILGTNFEAFDEKEHDFDGKKPEFEVNVSPSSSTQSKKHDDKTKKEAKGKNPVESLTGYRNLSAEFEDFFDNIINEVNAAEDITYSDNEDYVSTEVDFNNLETSITVSPIPTTRVHKDHPVTQIISDLSSPIVGLNYVLILYILLLLALELMLLKNHKENMLSD
nr:hypothetical protein [Tanacetum cinerariifolium]